MEKFDASHTDAASYKVIVDPVLHKEGYHCYQYSQTKTDEITNSDHFKHWFSQFIYQEYHLVKTDENKEERDYDPRVPDCHEGDVFIVSRESS